MTGTTWDQLLSKTENSITQGNRPTPRARAPRAISRDRFFSARDGSSITPAPRSSLGLISRRPPRCEFPFFSAFFAVRSRSSPHDRSIRIHHSQPHTTTATQWQWPRSLSPPAADPPPPTPLAPASCANPGADLSTDSAPLAAACGGACRLRTGTTRRECAAGWPSRRQLGDSGAATRRDARSRPSWRRQQDALRWVAGSMAAVAWSSR
jgi:hypothetical protein